MSIYFGFNSIPMTFLFRAMADNPNVPDPKNGSNNKSPSFEPAKIQGSISQFLCLEPG